MSADFQVWLVMFPLINNSAKANLDNPNVIVREEDVRWHKVLVKNVPNAACMSER